MRFIYRPLALFAIGIASVSGISAKTMAERIADLTRISSQEKEITAEDTYLLLDAMDSELSGSEILVGAVLELRVNDPGVRDILLKEFHGKRRQGAKAVIAGLVIQGGSFPEAENFIASLLSSEVREDRRLGLIGFGLSGNACFRFKGQLARLLATAGPWDANHCNYAFQLLGRRGARYEKELRIATATAIQDGRYNDAGLFLATFFNFSERSQATLAEMKRIATNSNYPDELRAVAARSLANSGRKHAATVCAILETMQFSSGEFEEERKRLLQQIQRFRTLYVGLDYTSIMGEM